MAKTPSKRRHQQWAAFITAQLIQGYLDAPDTLTEEEWPELDEALMDEVLKTLQKQLWEKSGDVEMWMRQHSAVQNQKKGL